VAAAFSMFDVDDNQDELQEEGTRPKGNDNRFLVRGVSTPTRGQWRKQKGV